MINKVILVGHVGKDPEIRHLDSNQSVANFTLATNEYYVKDGTRIEQTEWHNIVAWRQTAEYAEKYIRKGSLLYVEGRLRTRSWDDKEGGKHYTTEVVSDTIRNLTPKPATAGGNEPKEEPVKGEASTPADDLPF
ncbi:MAG: single-stranded DNA-binding protein [Bacteroidales bacterium]|jgi:single-strand DNA-binding protein|nr:single-stranded DNA-binding protein [Bacteroidales bacterium]